MEFRTAGTAATGHDGLMRQAEDPEVYFGGRMEWRGSGATTSPWVDRYCYCRHRFCYCYSFRISHRYCYCHRRRYSATATIRLKPLLPRSHQTADALSVRRIRLHVHMSIAVEHERGQLVQVSRGVHVGYLRA